MIVNEAKNTVSWAASWVAAAGSAPASHKMLAMLPKGKAVVFAEQVKQVQSSMTDNAAS